MNAQALESRLSTKNMQAMIAREIERAAVEAGHDADILFFASFYIILQESEFGDEPFVMVRQIDLKENRKGWC